jgi:hypothetical protein
LSAELAGEDCLVIGNMLSGPGVAPAVRGAFEERAGGDLCDRLLTALDAGERAGGETGGGALRSAALLVVDRESFPFVDLRIDDDPERRDLGTADRDVQLRRPTPGTRPVRRPAARAQPVHGRRIPRLWSPLRRLGALWETYRPLAAQFVARAVTPDGVHRSSSTTT